MDSGVSRVPGTNPAEMPMEDCDLSGSVTPGRQRAILWRSRQV